VPVLGTILTLANFHEVEDRLMAGHHIGEMIRNYGRSLFYVRHPGKLAEPPTRAFQRGVLAARMGMERDAVPYPFGTHAYIDWIDGYESSFEVARAMDLD
jgi:hypothetical protein